MCVDGLETVAVAYDDIVAVAFWVVFDDTHLSVPTAVDGVADEHFDVGAVVVAVFAWSELRSDMSFGGKYPTAAVD